MKDNQQENIFLIMIPWRCVGKTNQQTTQFHILVKISIFKEIILSKIKIIELQNNITKTKHHCTQLYLKSTDNSN